MFTTLRLLKSIRKELTLIRIMKDLNNLNDTLEFLINFYNTRKEENTDEK